MTGVGRLTNVASVELDGPYGLFVQGKYAYVVSDFDHALQIIDISDPTTPVGVGQLIDVHPDPSLALSRPRNVFVKGNHAYVTSFADGGLQVIDISDPTNPMGVGIFDDGAFVLRGAFDVFVQGNYAYVVGRRDHGFQIVDISDPTNPIGVGQLGDAANLFLRSAIEVFVQGNYAYVVAFDEDGLQVIDVSDPTSPTPVGQLKDDGTLAMDGPQVFLSKATMPI